MFSKIGFFRFVSGYAKPVESVDAAIKAHGNVGGSLIVLPEAFNIGRYYWDEGDCDHDRSILDRLQSVAKGFDVTFVAGIIVDEPERPEPPDPPYSSVYLIDGRSVPTPLSRKMDDDGSGKYKPCHKNYDPNNPLLYRDTWIAALICMDCDGRTLPAREQESALAQRLGGKRDDLPQIVCIPAYMGQHYSSEGIAGKWPNSYVVLANCDRWGAKSLVAKNGVTLILDERGDENVIILHEIG